MLQLTFVAKRQVVGGLCALTGQTVVDWEDHCNSFAFQARHLVARRLTEADSPLRFNDLWNSVAQSRKLIKEFNHSNQNKRFSRLVTIISYLHAHHVLLHAPLLFSPHLEKWRVSKEFARLAFIGKNYFNCQTLTRLHQLFPKGNCNVLLDVHREICSESSMRELFEKSGMPRLLPAEKRRKFKPSNKEKTSMLMAVIGELHWFVVRTKATDRTHNNALFPPSDVLILHVLSQHALESLVAESVFTRIRFLAANFRSIWPNFCESHASQILQKAYCPKALALKTEPCEPPVRSKTEPVAQLCDLFQKPCYGALRSVQTPSFNWKLLDTENGIEEGHLANADSLLERNQLIHKV